MQMARIEREAMTLGVELVGAGTGIAVSSKSSHAQPATAQPATAQPATALWPLASRGQRKEIDLQMARVALEAKALGVTLVSPGAGLGVTGGAGDAGAARGKQPPSSQPLQPGPLQPGPLQPGPRPELVSRGALPPAPAPSAPAPPGGPLGGQLSTSQQREVAAQMALIAAEARSLGVANSMTASYGGASITHNADEVRERAERQRAQGLASLASEATKAGAANASGLIGLTPQEERELKDMMEMALIGRLPASKK